MQLEKQDFHLEKIVTGALNVKTARERSAWQFRQIQAHARYLLCATAVALFSACGSKDNSLFYDEDEVSEYEPRAIEPWVRMCTPQPPLPLTPTQEPCNGVDDDKDGMTDPDCPNVLCDSDCDCPADGDCHAYQELVRGPHGETYPPGGACNFPHSECDEEYGECFGKRCPEGTTCYQGECLSRGDAGPCEPCQTGGDCAPHSRCIAEGGYRGGDNGRCALKLCQRDCGHEPCPENSGTVCSETATVFMSPSTGETFAVKHYICLPPGQGACIEDD